MKNQYQKKVIVSLTGRRDSLVTALLLKKQGYEVTGVIFVNRPTGYESESFTPNCYVSKPDEVKLICDQLSIPTFGVDITDEFEYSVIDKVVSSKIEFSGISSCFDCTKLRFSVLLEKMKVLGANYIATGHYAKVIKDIKLGKFLVSRSTEVEGDQSHLLQGLTQDILKHLLLPLGDLSKKEVIKISDQLLKNNNASIENDQLCFFYPKDTQEFKKQIPEDFNPEGMFVERETDTVIGSHKGHFDHYYFENNIEFSKLVSKRPDLEIIGFDGEQDFIYVGNKNFIETLGFAINKTFYGKDFDFLTPISGVVKLLSSNELVPCHIYFKNNGICFIELVKKSVVLIGEKAVVFESSKRGAKLLISGDVIKTKTFKLIDRIAQNEFIDEEDEYLHDYSGRTQDEKDTFF